MIILHELSLYVIEKNVAVERAIIETKKKKQKTEKKFLPADKLTAHNTTMAISANLRMLPSNFDQMSHVCIL